MVKRIADVFLKGYEDSGYILQQKARVLLVLIITVLFLTSGMLAVNIFREHSTLPVQVPTVIMFFASLFTLAALRTGRYQLAVQFFLTALLTNMWLILFLDKEQPLISRLDSIVYIPGLLIMVPLLAVKNRYKIFLYFLINTGIFIFFTITVSRDYGLSTFIFWDYMIDNIIVFLFMGVVSYNIFRIDTAAVTFATIAEKEVKDQYHKLTLSSNALEAANKNLLSYQDELKRSEEQYRTLVEMAEEVIWSANRDGYCTFVNTAVENIYGYTPEEMMGRHFSEFMAPEQAEYQKSLFVDMMKNKITSIKFEITHRSREGEDIHFIASAMLQKDKMGHITGTTGTFTDITQRKKAEKKIQEQNEELAASNEELEAMNEELVDSQQELIRNEEELKKNEDNIRALLNATSDTVFMLNRDGILLVANHSTSRRFKEDPQKFIGTNYFDYLVKSGQTERLSLLKEVIESRVPARFEDEYGGFIHDNSVYPIIDNAGNVDRIAVFSRDITAQKNSERQIQEQNKKLSETSARFEMMNEELVKRQVDIVNSEAKYRHLYENSLVGMMTTRISDGMVLKINEVGFRLFGFKSEDEIIGKKAVDEFYCNPRDRENLIHELAGRGAVYKYELEFKRQDGTSFWCEVTARAYPEEDRIESVIADITKRKIAEENVYKLTFFDSLTELPNKKMFLSNLKTEIIKSQRRGKETIFAVMCIGIDRFKHINDMHGTLVGDRLLRSIGERLTTTFRGDDLVSRFDGDKFMVLLAEIGDPDNILDIVRKTSDTFSKKFTIDDTDFNVTTALGVCIYPNDGETAEQLLINSETAMYTAKEQGRNSYHLFDADLNKDLLNRLRLEKELADAIIKKEFEMYYQPKVTYDGTIIGMEALIRWRSSTRGYISPAEFIDLAEKTGLIIDLGSLVLRQSCRQNRAWQKLGLPPVKVSVNLSPYQFRQKNIVNTIRAILDETGLEPQWLELEITESGIMENEEENIKKLHSLHTLGVSISIDDFGTGYSSLSKLKDYPIDTLKIDKIFVDEIPENQKSMMLATTIIDLAHNLGFKVVAEGIEKRSQLDFLESKECDFYQGYYFSRPLSSKDFSEMLSAGIKKN